MLIKERVSYLKGLADGMQISDATNEGKLLRAIIEVLDDIATEVDCLQEEQDQMYEQIEDIDEDLAELESIVFEDYEDDDDDCIGEMKCPHCNEKFTVFLDMLEDDNSIECPICHNEIELDWDCSCEECSDDYDEDDDED
jgi:hypothetical protein